MRVDLACISGSQDGLGHVRRLLCLGQTLEKRGVDVGYFSSDISTLPGVPIVRRAFQPLDHLLQHAGTLNAPGEARGRSILVLDMKHRTQDTLSRLASSYEKVICLSDTGHAVPGAHITINPNPFQVGTATPQINGVNGHKAHYFAGAEYCLITNPATAVSGMIDDAATAFKPDAGPIVVSFGGADDGRFAGAVIDRLAGRVGQAERIVWAVPRQLPSAPVLPENVDICAGKDLAVLMAKATVLICGAGVTCLEAMAGGTPFVAIPVSADQHLAGTWLENNGYAVLPFEKLDDLPAVVGDVKIRTKRARPELLAGAERVADIVLRTAL